MYIGLVGLRVDGFIERPARDPLPGSALVEKSGLAAEPSEQDTGHDGAVWVTLAASEGHVDAFRPAIPGWVVLLRAGGVVPGYESVAHQPRRCGLWRQRRGREFAPSVGRRNVCLTDGGRCRRPVSAIQQGAEDHHLAARPTGTREVETERRLSDAPPRI